MKKNTENNIIISQKIFVIIFIAAILFGAFTGYLINNRSKQILYVSEEEILALENERISNTKYENRELFFGKAKEASQSIIRLANNFKNENTYVVFSKGKVFGDNIRSIADELHKNLIEELENIE